MGKFIYFIATGCALSASSFAVLAATNEIPCVTTADINGNSYHDRFVRLEGYVQDVFRDELDPQYLFAVIQDEKGQAYVSFYKQKAPTPSPPSLIGCKVVSEGYCRPHNNVNSRLTGKELSLAGSGSLKILERANASPFDIPLLQLDRSQGASRVASIGKRRILGKVLARRGAGELLICTSDNTISRVELQDVEPPQVGDSIEVVGTVETDIHCINFSRALWRKTGGLPANDQEVTRTTARQLLFNENGETKIKIRRHGRPIRVEAIVRSLPDPNYSDRIIFAESDGVTFPIDANTCPEVFGKLQIGATIAATGICWMEIENWRPNAVFPKVKGFTLVLRTADDVTIVSRPPWWTTGRLLGVIGALVAALLGVVIWNRALKKVAERRGRQLFREKASRLESELKTAERSRLAVELHDSISQVLTGVALKIKASQAQVRTDPDNALKNLNIAENTLRSSREELRYCLWDLRNNILDLPNLEEAIRQTLKPQTGDIALAVRFPVSHRKLSDNTIHIILQIVRELAVNAIRHGAATSIRIAGSLDNGVLAFSVQDNGSGFDPASAPGPEQGHFGLLGVQDRLAHYDGTIDVQSSPGKGTKASIRMILSDDTESTAS